MIDQQVYPPSQNTSQKELRTWQAQLVRGALHALVIIGIFAAIATAVNAYTNQVFWPIYFSFSLLLIMAVISFGPKIPYNVQSIALLIVFYFIGLVNLIAVGPSSESGGYFITLVFAAGLLYNRRSSIVLLIISSMTFIAFGALVVSGRATPLIPTDITNLTGWVRHIVNLIMLGSVVVASLGYLMPRVATAIEQSRTAAIELETQRALLEEQVVRRTADLERRNTQLEAATQVIRLASQIQNADDLIHEIVHIIAKEFNFYHCGIFLVDRRRKYAVLEAASSEEGMQALANNFQLELGQANITQPVVERGLAQIYLDANTNPAVVKHLELLEIQSAIALPLRSGNEILGFLDIQCREPNALMFEDIPVLQTLADQIALAMANMRLVQQLEQSLQAERSARGELTSSAWHDFVQLQQKQMRKSFDPRGILASLGKDEILSVPIRVRGRSIGQIRAAKPAGNRDWSPTERAMLQTLVDQLGVALDSARLYEETQQKARQEELIGEATTRMRETLDIETVLKTAAQELRQALELAEVEVHLGSYPDA
ncbi:MAG: GAF domain-containing protein [Anaerolineae bacterium]|nr:GAF domain-containing protein [Anaerolineae bacterium]MBL6965234.1 GAF domain-containing protein [Anaerolineales bacterium]